MLQNYTFIADKRGVRRSFLLFFSLFLLQVTTFAQNDVRITIRENNITVIEALKKVEKQSGFLLLLTVLTVSSQRPVLSVARKTVRMWQCENMPMCQ
jgi:hypothetical protein